MAHSSTDFAALRWYANYIENLAIQAYGKDWENYDAIAGILDQTLAQLRTLGLQPVPQLRCPWEICPDGSCRVRCGVEPAPTPTSA